jgi:putative transposase
MKRKHPRRLAKKREITAPNQLWEIDIKYGHITGEDCFFFIMSILDVYDRMIIDYHTGLSCTGHDAAYILSRACARRLPEGKVVVRTDNGPQFISMAFETACEKLPVEHERISPTAHPIVMLTLRHFMVFWRRIVCKYMGLRTLRRHIT